MATKKKGGSRVTRRTRARSRKSKRRSRQRPKWPLWLAAVLIALTVYAWQRQAIYEWMNPLPTTEAASAPPPVTAGTPEARPQPAAPERFDLPDVAREEPPAAEGIVLPAAGVARIALVIDDLGRSVADVDRIESLEVPVTYALLPFESHTDEVRERILAGGHELICHLPMEPSTSANPGPGALTSDMNGRSLAKATRDALRAVPGAVGVNNHMGSSLTADRRAMQAILRVIGNRDLYFLDSRTSADSVGFAIAREKQIPAAERQVFLDGELTAEWIDGQFRRALEIARVEGAAVVIGHPHDITLATLQDWVPRAREAGYEFVEVSKLIERSGSPSG